MKLCVNCRHLQRSRFNEWLWICEADPHQSPVTGLSEAKYAFIEREYDFIERRAEHGECGPEARLFSPISEDNNGVPG